MNNQPNEANLPNLSKLANPDESVLGNESALGMDEDPNTEKPAGAAELMTPDNAPGPEEN